MAAMLGKRRSMLVRDDETLDALDSTPGPAWVRWIPACLGWSLFCAVGQQWLYGLLLPGPRPGVVAGWLVGRGLTWFVSHDLSACLVSGLFAHTFNTSVLESDAGA